MSAVGSILTNSGALTALNSIAQTSQTTNQLQNELASGLSISSPSDNPAGYITAQGFTSQINGLTQATSNANQGVSLLQTAQSAIGQQIGVVQQLNSIAVQAANGTQTASETASLQTLVGQLTQQVGTIANQTQFNNINLLDGSFSGKQLQVGANEGQTMDLSINNTSASAIGMYTAGGGAGSVYTGAVGSAFVGLTAALAGGSSLAITGPAGGQSTVATTAGESAYDIANDVNAAGGTTGVQAEATNTETYTFAAGTTSTSFTVQSSANAGKSAAVSVNAAISTGKGGLSSVVSQINQQTQNSGIVASSASGKLTLTQEQGKNIAFSGIPKTAAAGSAPPQAAGTAVADLEVQQGQVQFQSSGAFSVTGATKLVGTSGNAELNSLAKINVGTTAGANAAINIVKYALQGLNNQDGQLGAVQQRLSATINNLNSTNTNATTALGVVQDANIPAVANQLTQAQIQAQSGVAALKSSTELQQTYLSLLP